MSTRSILFLMIFALACACDSDPPTPPDPIAPPNGADKPANGAQAADAGGNPEGKLPEGKLPEGKPPEGQTAESKLPELELKREAAIAKLVTELLKTDHLRRITIDDAVSEQAFDLYLERLDPARMFLLEEDVTRLKSHAKTMDDELAAGRLSLSEEGGALLKRRLAVVRKAVEGHLKQPFDTTIEETLETEPDKRPWCKTEAELNDRWRKVLKLEVIRRAARYEEILEARDKAAKEGDKPEDEDVLDTAPATPQEREVKSRERTAKDYEARFIRLEQEEHIDDIELFINALVGAFDPHTVFLPPDRKENFDIQMSGSLEGIGAVLQVHEHYVRIVSIVPGSASWQQGELEAGDLILSVAQKGKEAVDVVDMRLQDVVQLIRGPKGTVVTLTVKKPDDRVLVIPITRDIVKIEESYAKGAVLNTLGDDAKIGYIQLPSFYGNTRNEPSLTPERGCTEDVRKLLDIFTKRGITKVIFDLRGNGGGLLSAARTMSGLFIEKGPIVQTRSADGQTEILEDFDPTVSFNGQVIVLVDRFSASASEILAGALQDYGRALIVGSPQTHGKGTVQMIMSLDRMADPSTVDGALRPLGVLKITRQQFFRVSGSSTQNKGVIPDLIFPDPVAHIESGERYLDHPIPWSSVEGVPFKAWQSKLDIATLNARSKARQSADEAFERDRQRAEFLAKLREQSVENLNLEKWKAERKAERDQLDALSPEQKDIPPRIAVEELRYTDDPAPVVDDKSERRTGQPRKDAWKEDLIRDHWLSEAILIFKDMAAPPPTP